MPGHIDPGMMPKPGLSWVSDSADQMNRSPTPKPKKSSITFLAHGERVEDEGSGAIAGEDACAEEIDSVVLIGIGSDGVFSMIHALS